MVHQRASQSQRLQPLQGRQQRAIRKTGGSKLLTGLGCSQHTTSDLTFEPLGIAKKLFWSCFNDFRHVCVCVSHLPSTNAINPSFLGRRMTVTLVTGTAKP